MRQDAGLKEISDDGEPASEHAVLVIDRLDIQWVEQVEQADGTKVRRNRKLKRTSAAIKLNPAWIVIGLIVVVTVLYKPEALSDVLDLLTRLIRAG